MVEMQVRNVQTTSETYFRVVLQEKNGAARLHIVIGPSEAGAISVAHEGQKSVRPLSYDLACGLLEEVNAQIDRVQITALRDGIYYAEIHLQDTNGETKAIDSRPSDAIAMALRADAPIFAAEEVLEGKGREDLVSTEAPGLSEAAVENKEDSEVGKPAVGDLPSLGIATDSEVGGHPEASPTPSEVLRESGSSHENLTPVDLLKRRLRHAVSEEAYEEAARLRDCITQIHQGN